MAEPKPRLARGFQRFEKVFSTRYRSKQTLIEGEFATAVDFEKTALEHWQTDWRTDYIQNAALEKYALEVDGTRDLVGLGQAEIRPI